jgi:hypothetical protein
MEPIAKDDLRFVFDGVVDAADCDSRCVSAPHVRVASYQHPNKPFATVVSDNDARM